jgi:hypothetical protein
MQAHKVQKVQWSRLYPYHFQITRLLEPARQSRAAQEVDALWMWTRAQLEGSASLNNDMRHRSAA